MSEPVKLTGVSIHRKPITVTTDEMREARLADVTCASCESCDGERQKIGGPILCPACMHAIDAHGFQVADAWRLSCHTWEDGYDCKKALIEARTAESMLPPGIRS